MKIIVYTTTNCPHCAQLKAALADLGHEYEERDMATAESMTELKVNGCFALSAPVLRVGDRFHEWSILEVNGAIDKVCLGAVCR